MPEKATVKRARKAKREGKAPSTQAGEFVREEIHHIREGKHGARSTKQAIAIGLSKARKSGVKLKPKKEGKSAATQTTSTRARGKPSPARARAAKKTLKKEGSRAASRAALSRHAKQTARRRKTK